MTEDIRLSQVVGEKTDENTTFVTARGIKLMEMFQKFLDKEFEGKYDETYFMTLYVRKGNDINTLASTQLLLGGCITPADSAMIKFFSTNQEVGGGIKDIDDLDE